MAAQGHGWSTEGARGSQSLLLPIQPPPLSCPRPPLLPMGWAEKAPPSLGGSSDPYAPAPPTSHLWSPCWPRGTGAVGPHLHQLHEVFEVDLLVDAQLAGGVDDAVVLHLPLAADAQRVVPGVVGALPHQKQPRLGGVQQPLRLLPSDLPMKPPATGTQGRVSIGMCLGWGRGAAFSPACMEPACPCSSLLPLCTPSHSSFHGVLLPSPQQPWLLQTGSPLALGCSRDIKPIHPPISYPSHTDPTPTPFFLPAAFTTITLGKGPTLACNPTIHHLPSSAGSSRGAQSFPQQHWIPNPLGTAHLGKPNPCSFCLSTSLSPERDSVGTRGQLDLWSDALGMLPPVFPMAESPVDTHGMRLSLIPAFTPSRFCT